MLPEHDEEHGEEGEEPVGDPVSHGRFHLGALPHESWRLDVLDLSVNVDRDMGCQEGQDQLKHHDNDVANRSVDYIDDCYGAFIGGTVLQGLRVQCHLIVVLEGVQRSE